MKDKNEKPNSPPIRISSASVTREKMLAIARMKLKRKDGITYLLIKGHVSALMEWPVFLFMIRRYVLYVRLDNWLWVPAKGRDHAMIDWDHWIYGKWRAFLCFQVYRTEPVPPPMMWTPSEFGNILSSDPSAFIRVDGIPIRVDPSSYTEEYQKPPFDVPVQRNQSKS